MARKITTAQKYERLRKAIKVLANELDSPVTELKELKRPNKISLNKAQKEYKKIRKEVQELYKDTDYKLPTSAQLEKMHNNRETLPAPYVMDFGKDFVDSFRQTIVDTYNDWLSNVEAKDGARAGDYWRDNTEAIFDEAMHMLDEVIAKANNDYDLVADLIKAQPDYDVMANHQYLEDSDGEQYCQLCAEFFTAVMVDLLSRT